MPTKRVRYTLAGPSTANASPFLAKQNLTIPDSDLPSPQIPSLPGLDPINPAIYDEIDYISCLLTHAMFAVCVGRGRFSKVLLSYIKNKCYPMEEEI